MPRKLSIGIVGGGITGLYCAYRLAKHHDVTVFETLDRFGGRIETVQLAGGFLAECGPMRFELATQPYFKKLAGKLGINFRHFNPPTGASPLAEFPKYDLLSHEMSTKQKDAIAAGPDQHTAMFSHLTSTLDLLKFGVYRIFHPDPTERKRTLPEVVDSPEGIKSKIADYADSWSDYPAKGQRPYDDIRTTIFLDETLTDGVPRGQRLYNYGFWNALSTVLSPSAVAKIRDTGTFYHLMPENPSASEWSIFWLRLFTSNAALSTIEAGVDQVIKNLCLTLRQPDGKRKGSVTLKSSIVVTEVFAGNNELTGKVCLRTTEDANSAAFDHIILAMAAVPLRNLKVAFPSDIEDYLNGVIPFPLLKVFVTLRDPWWKVLPEAHEGAHRIPTREVHYFWPTDGSTDRGMIMFYMDRPATAYWGAYIRKPHSQVQIKVPPALERDIARQLAQLWPKNGRDEATHLERVEASIITVAIRDWSQEPFGAACHAWKPGMDVPTALKKLQAFSLRGEPETGNVHVCGEAYSDYQGFIEGSLRSAVAVMKTIVLSAGLHVNI